MSLDGTLSQRAITDANSSLGSCQSLNEHQLASVQIYRIVRGRCLVQLMGPTRTALVEGTTTQLKQISAKQAITNTLLERASMWREGGYVGPYIYTHWPLA